MVKVFVDIEESKIVRILDSIESIEIERKWMNIYCKDSKGVNTRSFKWHIFSSGRYEALDGKEASDEYEKHIAPKYYVMSNRSHEVLITDTLPKRLNFSDCYVFPLNFSWTMAFTHEEGWLGPYFAKHRDYKILEKENERYRGKLLQKEKAIRNGWL